MVPNLIMIQLTQEDIQKFKPYIKMQASKFSSASTVCDFEDLQQAGYIGLINAKKSFRKDGGAKWSTYAITCIKNAILTESICFIKEMTLPKGIAINYYRFKRLYIQKLSEEEIKETLDLSDKHYNTFKSLYLSLSCFTNSNNDIHTQLVGNLEDQDASMYDIDFISEVLEIYESLSDTEKEIMEFKQSNMILKDIGEKYGISAEAVRQKYNKIIDKFASANQQEKYCGKDSS